MAYDVRGEIGKTISSEIVYKITRALVYHLKAKSVILGRDARETSPEYALAVKNAVLDAGCDVLDIGLSGTEEVYSAVCHFDASAGIQVTASHNPINFNGLKMVKSQSRPLDQKLDLNSIKRIAETKSWTDAKIKGKAIEIEKHSKEIYAKKVLSFINPSNLENKKIVVNFGNGAAGPTFDFIIDQLSRVARVPDFVLVNHAPDPTFPNGVPNPILQQNQESTGNIIRNNNADFGVAFDGDFDRCFFFDNYGSIIPGEYMVGLIAKIFLEREKHATIVHDTRVIWNTQDVVENNKGKTVQSRTGHSFIKAKMREVNAIYGGELSAHHYFRDFSYCDSGMIPFFLVYEYICVTGKSLSELLQDRYTLFPSSGEINFKVNNPDATLASVIKKYGEYGKMDTSDGLSFSFSEWRFNLRKSNTENLVRLNIEQRDNIDPKLIDKRVQELKGIIEQS